MEVRRFHDEYSETAPLYGLTPSELRRRERDRWIAVDGDHVRSAAETLLRPDNRLFVTFRGDPAVAPVLAAEVMAGLGRSLHARAAADSSLAKMLVAAGFSIEITIERFVVPFDAALSSLRAARLPARYELIDVATAEADRLFSLDNAIRDLVPGCDGWIGNRAWFDDEIDDPASYVIAVESSSGSYVGLARVWRNDEGPRFGLIGVLPGHRRPSPATALLRQVLEEAAGWGCQTFTTETASTNQMVHPRLSRIGVSGGRAHQFVLRPS